MKTLEEQIAALDEKTAIGLLQRIAEAQRRHGEFSTELTPETQTALQEFAGESESGAAGEVDAGEVARAALLAMAEDPEQRPAVEALVTGPEAESFAVAEAVLAVGAVLIALQTRGRFAVKEGRVEFAVAKPSMSSKHLVELAGKLLAWLRKGA